MRLLPPHAARQSIAICILRAGMEDGVQRIETGSLKSQIIPKQREDSVAKTSYCTKIVHS